ncbi:hypothetical protein JXL83_01695 [candidate division WOR-3 bacterium]|nr:hypothetical protein [candidate division WOR-3 bacterium]
MKTRNSDLIGWLSIFISITGLLLPFIVMRYAVSLKDFLWSNGAYIVWAFQLLSLIFGFAGRRSQAGKSGMVMAVLIAAILVLYLSFPVSLKPMQLLK